MSFLERVCKAFQKANLKYAVVGGHAVALHGAVRGTIDIDIALSWNKKSLEAAVQTLQALGLESRLPITAEDVFLYRDEYIKNRNLIAWSFYNPKDLSEQVDIIINYDLKGKKTTLIPLPETDIRVLDKKSLIKMKATSGRQQDLEDIAALKLIP